MHDSKLHDCPSDIKIPTHDPQTGELNPYYEELTGEKNPLSKVKLSENQTNLIKSQKMLVEGVWTIELVDGTIIQCTNNVDFNVIKSKQT